MSAALKIDQFNLLDDESCDARIEAAKALLLKDDGSHKPGVADRLGLGRVYAHENAYVETQHPEGLPAELVVIRAGYVRPTTAGNQFHADVKALGDISPWRMAVVLETSDQSARIGFQPGRELGGAVSKQRQTGIITLDGVRWAKPTYGAFKGKTPAAVSQVLQPGDVIYADPLFKDGNPVGGQYRLRQLPEISGAMVVMDNSGAVKAMVGGKSYKRSQYNRATKALRQPGSAWKLFVYLAALEAGYKPDDAVVDEPVTIEGWSPRNSSGDYAGQIDVRTAFAYSKNTVAAQLGNEVGYGTIAAMARRFGITTPVNTMPSMVLGTSDVRLIDMTRAFASVSAHGLAVEPYGISKIVTTDGRVLYQHPSTSGAPLVQQYVAAGITDLLQTAVNIGTGRAAQIGRPVAGKTGTTSSNKDGWFLGFSSGITTGVWMGRDDAKAVPGLQGGTAPARAFAQYMRVAVAKRPVEQFDTQLKLPAWQLEPDDEALSANPSDYFYVDEQGNLIDPTHAKPAASAKEGANPADQRDIPPAANQDILDSATGRQPRPQRSTGARQPAGQ